MKIWLLIIALCFYSNVEAQNTETDSLKKLLVVTKESAARVNILEGLSYAYLASYPDTALQYVTEGLALAKEINDDRGEASCTETLGSVYFHVGDYARALEMYFTALAIKERMKNQKGIAITYFNIASVYAEEEDYRHALDYTFKAKQIDEKLKDSSGILFDAYSLGSIYLRMQKIDSALYYVNQSYKLAIYQQDNNMIGAILNTFGEIYIALNNTTLAADYYNKSIPYTLAINDNEVLTSNYYGLAKAYKQRNMLDSSIYYTRKAFFIAREAPFLKQVMETSSYLTNLFSSKKQFDSAFYYQQISVTTKDSLFSVEQLRKVQNLKFQEQERQQTIETARIKYQNKIKLFVVIFASSVLLLIAIVLWRNNKQKQKANTLLQQEKEKVEKTLSELRSTQSQLIQSEKMASLGELTAGIAHEIQNPLNFVNNFSDINRELAEELKKELTSGDKEEAIIIAENIKDNEQKINYHGKRAESIVNGMLQHSRTSTGQKELTDVNALVDEYLRLSYHGFRAKDKSFNATIETDFDESIGKIKIVPQDMGRVFLNQFNNAFYSVNEKKKNSQSLNIEYKPTVSAITKAISLPSGESGLEIRIKDNGNGIPRNVLDKIFQPFFTTKPTGHGTGLGLSLSYDIIKAHEGEIKVETKQEKGAEFIIQLPIT